MCNLLLLEQTRLVLLCWHRGIAWAASLPDCTLDPDIMTYQQLSLHMSSCNTGQMTTCQDRGMHVDKQTQAASIQDSCSVAAGGTVDLDLAVASTLGSGLFISCVMTASVVLIKTVDIVDRTAFVRDISAYIVANLLVLLFLCNGRLAAWEAALLLLLYAIYVALACYTSK